MEPFEEINPLLLRVAKSQNHHRTRFEPRQNAGADVYLRCSALSEDALKKKRGEKRCKFEKDGRVSLKYFAARGMEEFWVDLPEKHRPFFFSRKADKSSAGADGKDGRRENLPHFLPSEQLLSPAPTTMT